MTLPSAREHPGDPPGRDPDREVQSRVGGSGAAAARARAAALQREAERDAGHRGAERATDLRSRLGWFLLVRLLLVSAFLGGAAVLYTRGHAATGPDLRLGLIALGYGITAISGLLLPSVRRVLLYAAVQIGVDLGLVSLVIVLTGALESPLPVLYNLVILNAALLGLARGITATAAAAALCYGGVLAILRATTPDDVHVAQHAFTHATNLLSFFAIAMLARYLTTQLAAAENLLAQNREALGRVQALQRLVANAVDNGLLVTDAGGRITSANPTAAEILGLDPTAGAGMLLETLLPAAADLPADAPPVELTIGDSSDARRVLRVKAATVTDTYQHPIGRMYVLQDVTTVREMESRLRDHETIEAYASSVLPLDDTPVTAFEGLVGESEVMRRLFTLIAKVAPTDSTVLITGESGTGKELVARAIHARSLRGKHEFVAVNCGAIPETLIESELFGHVRGAFTGAIADRHGLFRQAHGGTIFLDEIAELPPPMQVRLLRVLQDHQLAPVGGSGSITVDVRVVAATNRDLERLVADGRFREDLYYRLNVIRLTTPSLRERPEDVPPLLLHLLRHCSTRHGKTVARVSPRTMRTLVTYAYPGNVRELENIVDHAVTLCDGDILTEQDLPAYLSARPEPAVPALDPGPTPAPEPLFLPGRSLDDQLATYERDMLVAALDRAGGVRKRAAELLGIKYRSLRHRLSKYGLAVGDDDLDLGSESHA
jgi:transcriptional regulator with PAS, ATPase and Fis domain